MRVSDYARAAQVLIEEGKPIEVVLKNLRRSLERRGSRSLYIPVLHSLLNRLNRTTTENIPRITIARVSDEKRLESSINKSLSEMSIDQSTERSVVIDDTLIGGYTVEARSTVIDKSYKRQLLTLYRSLKG